MANPNGNTGMNRADELEAAIRKHRDQRGDDRCFRDDDELYMVLGDHKPREFSSPVEMLENCKRFIQSRFDPSQPYVSPQRRIDELEGIHNMQKVVDYCAEEVRRQGHETSKLDGIRRTAWMLNAWCYALNNADCKPEIPDIVLLGKRVEREKNARGLRRCGVRVGDRICPHPNEVPALLAVLFSRRSTMTPLEFYKEFEMIHPFVDGNGRTGKILMNWLDNRLLDPIFPPDDLWGDPIRNP